MKNILLGMIFGLILASTITVNAYSPSYTEWEQEVVDLLEEIRDNGDDLIGKIETLIDKH